MRVRTWGCANLRSRREAKRCVSWECYISREHDASMIIEGSVRIERRQEASSSIISSGLASSSVTVESHSLQKHYEGFAYRVEVPVGA